MSWVDRVARSRPTDAKVPTLSFVVPVFRPPVDVLRATFASIDAQTFDDWECIAVDDASHDETVRELLVRWADADARHRLVQRPVNGGIAAATNDGIAAARGAVIAFVDHDDLVDPAAASDVVEHFEQHPEHDLVYTDERLIDIDDRVLSAYPKPDYSPVRHLGQHFLAHLVAVRAEAIGDLRVRSEFEPAQDVDFVHRLIEQATARGRGVGHIAHARYSWRALAGSSATSASQKSGMSDAVLRSVTAALDRRGIDADATIVEHEGEPTTSVLVIPRLHTEPTCSVFTVDRDTTGADLRDAVAAGDTDLVVLTPTGAPDGWWRAFARVLRLPGVAAAGPILVDETGDIVSVGRTIDPTLRDAMTGTADGPGPWGAYLVHREVSALAPWAVVLDRRAAVDAGGIDARFGADVAIADLCARLRAAGNAVVCSPVARLKVDPGIVAPDRRRDDDWATLVAQRPDADWAERYDLLGVAPVGLRHVSAWEHAHGLIAQGVIDLVTTDVFDTLVTRPTSRPSDLFSLLGRRLAERGVLAAGVTATRVAAARTEAEARARRRVARGLRLAGDERAPEVTLSEIWSELGVMIGVEPTVGAEIELELEADQLRPIPEAVDVLQAARRAGCAVVAVSDIYLSSDQLADLLTRTGIDLGLLDAVVTSSDRARAKVDGLLAEVIDERGVTPDRVLHLGDNDIADAATARGLGAHVAHVAVPATRRHITLPGSGRAAASAELASDSGVEAAIRAVLVDAGSFGAGAALQFGAGVAGPALVGFASWAARTAAELGAPRLHCLLREGAEIERLIDIVAPGRIPTTLVPASRWVLMRAACVDADPDQLITALARRGPIGADHVERAFGCAAAEVTRVWETDVVMPSELDLACARLAGDERLREQIIRAAAELRARVLRMLRHAFDGADPIVLADVGWGGTIQEGITRILRSVGDERQVIGLYFALSRPGEERLAAGADMRSYLPHGLDDAAASRWSKTVAHHADSIERILTPQIATLIDVGPDGEPIGADHQEYQTPSLLSARAGVESLARRLGPTGLDANVVDHPTFRAGVARDLATVITEPSAAVARELLAWEHDDVAGAGLRQLSGGIDESLVPAMTLDNADLVGRQIGTWVEGLAAVHNPALAIQLAAQRSRGEGQRLVPRDGLGPALIAAFPLGSDDAALQVRRDPGLGARGQLALRLSGAVPSLRALRFDVSDGDALALVERFDLDLVTNEGETQRVDVRDHLAGPGIRTTGPHRFAQRAGGFVTYSPDPSSGLTVREIDVTIVFRRWPLPPDDPALARRPVIEFGERAGRRLGRSWRQVLERRGRSDAANSNPHAAGHAQTTEPSAPSS